PGVRVRPPRFPATPITPSVRPAASLYAVVKSAWAWAAAASAAWIAPFTIPGGNPVTAVPGLNPRSPLTMVPPVLVTVEAPRTAKLAAAPRTRGACALGATCCKAKFRAGVPGTGSVPSFKAKVAVLIVKGSIVLLKVTATPRLTGTPLAALAGTTKLTKGAVVSSVTPVVKFQLKLRASALPARSRVPVVIVAV